MASILDSYRETYSDKFGFAKILIFAIPLFYFYTQYLAGRSAFLNVLLYVYITIFFLFGFIAEVTSSVVNEEDWVMPALNPFKIALTTIKTAIAMLPSTFICVFAANFITPYINITPWLDNTFKTIIWLIVAAVILTSFLMFIKTKNILRAFNLKTLSDKAGDVILAIIFFVLQLLVINIPTFGFLGYSIYILFGFGLLFYFFVAYAIVFNLVASAHYLAQLQYEIIGIDENNFMPLK